ncbi:helicase HerA domain-containing protein [Marispirochaeta sp.]|uniref:ATP-binding protein n=1 Tax=Marispirochaeta sp. TaxID=2038653 RepID=UPI0029C78EB7|nr:DUF87 domain-containing protein [Marispirochaeta sp.]
MSFIRRLISLIIITALLLLICYVFEGGLPNISERLGAWFMVAAAYLILALLTTPFFERPVDVTANSIAILLLLTQMETAVPESYIYVFNYARQISLWYVMGILFLSVIATITNRNGNLKNLNRVVYRLSIRLGSASLLYVLAMFFALAPLYFSNLGYALSILGLWVLICFASPIEQIVDIVTELIGRNRTIHRALMEPIGEVRLFHNPGIAIARISDSQFLNPGDSLVVTDSKGCAWEGIPLATADLTTERWIYILIQDAISTPTNESLLGESIYKGWMKRDTITKESLLGFVIDQSNLEAVKFHHTGSIDSVSDGLMIEAEVGSSRILYQVTGAETSYDQLDDKSTLGFTKVTARKIGEWFEKEQRFRMRKWLPSMYSPVYRWDDKSGEFQFNSIGYVPNTSFYISADPLRLVTHNTAVLGILGSGKSFLTFELISRMIIAGIKVICFDITNQYAGYLSDFYAPDIDDATDQSIQDQTSRVNTNVERTVEDGGGTKTFIRAVKEHVEEFLQSERCLRIVNPEFFEVMKQDSRPFNDEASFVSMSAPEVVSVFTESVLGCINTEMTDRAKVCVIFEEAHSLIPEFHSIAQEGEKSATARTARAILQGRKYGLGCVVVTQRTANVTKSILNQCNNIFALRTYDTTGIGFLETYLGDDYAGLLSTLEERHAVAYGNALASESPLIIKLNDREDFITELKKQDCVLEIRSKYNVAKRVPVEPESDSDQDSDEFEDDIPF